jgi:hypothetical protein
VWSKDARGLLDDRLIAGATVAAEIRRERQSETLTSSGKLRNYSPLPATNRYFHGF